jgi:hypothetical protein
MAVYLIALLVMLVGAGIVCLFFPIGRLRLGLRPLNEPMPERPPDRSAQAPRQPPAFLEVLRDKEQSMNVGSPETEKGELDLQEILQKEKTVVTNPATNGCFDSGMKFAGKK